MQSDEKRRWRLEAMQEIVRNNLEAVQEKDEDGWSPLHFAAGAVATLDVVAFLVDQYPDALQETTTPRGFTPLHLAAAGEVPIEVV